VDAESLEPSVTDEPAAAGLPVLRVVVAVTVEPFGDLTPVEPQALLYRPHAAGGGIGRQLDYGCAPVLLAVYRDPSVEGAADGLCQGGRPDDGRTGAAPWSGGASGAPSGLRGAGTVPGVADDVLGVEGRVPIPVLGVHAAEATGKDPLDLLDR